MARGSNALEEARSLLKDRLKELEAERDRVQKALANLGGSGRRPGRPRGARGKRRRRTGTRADEALKLLSQNPGMRPSEIAEKMGIKPNYIYRLMNELQKDGLVRKRGKGYLPS
jgi:sugar-specific transcriptional regulator TrmB